MSKKITILLLLITAISLSAIAMETDTFNAFRKYAAQTNQANFSKKTLLAWLNAGGLDSLLPLYRGLGSHSYSTTYKSKSYASGMYSGSQWASASLVTRIDYEKTEENNYKKCNFYSADFWRDTDLTDDQKTNALDTHFARLLYKLKKCNEISFSSQFREKMNAYTLKAGKFNGQSPKTLFNLFTDLATCHKEAGKEEKCTFTFDEK